MQLLEAALENGLTILVDDNGAYYTFVTLYPLKYIFNVLKYKLFRLT